MKTIVALVFLAGSAAPALAQYYPGSNPNSHSTNGYVTNRGTYVEPHYQTNPNSTQTDNYNTRGNVNPYNGQTGTRTPRW